MRRFKMELEKLWEGEMFFQRCWQLANEVCSFTVDVYTDYEDLEELRDGVSEFEKFKWNEFEMLFGADTKTSLDYLRLRFFKLDRLGHIGVEIELK